MKLHANLRKQVDESYHIIRCKPLWSVWIEGEGGGEEQSRVDLVQN